ncbi:MAG: phosphoribosylglycinamide formyltransferase-1 [Planctomycetota bacterium]|jgi:phosphoribosylglycinamide formyltransferase-1
MSKTLSLVVMISGNGSNLQSIIDAIEAGRLNANIASVVSNNTSAYGLMRAKNHQLPTQVIDHRNYADRDQFDRAIGKLLRDIDPDFVVLAGFMRILGAELIASFKNRILNIHPSLLPAYKGLNTHRRALENGEHEHGVSIHLVTAELDDGPVLLQGRYPIDASDDVESLQRKGHNLEHHMYPQLLSWLSDGDISIENDNILHHQLPMKQPVEI